MKQERDPATAAFLEDIYARCGAAERLGKDPLAIAKRYPRLADREIAGLICSTLAFGSVDLILRACDEALAPLGPNPAGRLIGMSDAEIVDTWASFKYRFVAPFDMACLFAGTRRILEAHGSLESLFIAGDGGGDTVVDALCEFARSLRAAGAIGGRTIRDNLLPDPARGSACKRLFLFLRWFVRKDAIDPGGWEHVDRARLVVPLDTHMTRICHERLGFLPNPRADLKAALRATECFKLYAPEDPVKYDFALTRPSIDPRLGDEYFGCSP